MGIGGLEFVSGLTRFPGLVRSAPGYTGHAKDFTKPSLPLGEPFFFRILLSANCFCWTKSPLLPQASIRGMFWSSKPLPKGFLVHVTAAV